MGMPASFLIAAATVAYALAGVAEGQTPPGTTVSGAVRDSSGGTPLIGAMVQLAARDDPSRFERSALTDSLGRFTLHDVPVGTYMLGFFHPILDSIGIESPLREVRVGSLAPVVVDLTLPSPARITAAICGAAVAADSGAVVTGTVRRATEGSPVAGATVTGSWYEYTLARGGLTRQPARRTATTGDNGWFALCNVPSGGTVALLASREADSTDVLEVEIPSSGFLRRELFLGSASAAPPAVASAGTAADSAPPVRAVRTGDGQISGSVLAAATSRPLAGAQVRIVGGPETQTNAAGEWTLTNAPTGTRTLEIRALGYYPVRRDVDVIAGAPPLRIALSTFKAVLDTVKVTASRLTRDRIEFEQRRRMGLGRFITEADMLRHPVTRTSDVFRRMPGVRLYEDLILMRGIFAGDCEPTFYIDGMRMLGGADAKDIDDWVNPREVSGIEVYTESNAPPQFQPGLTGCGSIVIWTKGRL